MSHWSIKTSLSHAVSSKESKRCLAPIQFKLANKDSTQKFMLRRADTVSIPSVLIKQWNIADVYSNTVIRIQSAFPITLRFCSPLISSNNQRVLSLQFKGLEWVGRQTTWSCYVRVNKNKQFFLLFFSIWSNNMDCYRAAAVVWLEDCYFYLENK